MTSARLSMDLGERVVCPACRGRLDVGFNDLGCRDCDRLYHYEDGIPRLIAEIDEAKRDQIHHFDSEVDEEFEITRPHGLPSLYGWLLEEKFRRSARGIEKVFSGSNTLCVCAGSGLDAEFLARAGAQVVAADISPGAARRAAERARRYALPIAVLVADVERLPFADRSFDVVYVHDGLHHLERPGIGLAEMARVARLAVSVTEPMDAAVTGLAVRCGLALDWEESGNRVARLRPDEVTRTLQRQGLKVIHCERYGMFYRHEPGWAMRLLSRSPLKPLATGSLLAANRIGGRLGNKVSVVAVRP